MAGLCLPLPTLRRRPRDRLRTARGRCGAHDLHRRGLSPHTPRRSPGAPLLIPCSAKKIPRSIAPGILSQGLELKHLFGQDFDDFGRKRENSLLNSLLQGIQPAPAAFGRRTDSARSARRPDVRGAAFSPRIMGRRRLRKRPSCCERRHFMPSAERAVLPRTSDENECALLLDGCNAPSEKTHSTRSDKECSASP